MAELEKSLETLASVQLKLSNENAASAKKAAEDAAKQLESNQSMEKRLEALIASAKAGNRTNEKAEKKLADLQFNMQITAEKAEATAQWQQSSAGQAVALKKELESQGKIAEDNKEFQKLSYQARKADYKKRLKDATSPAAKKEIREEARADAKKNGSRLDKIGAAVGGMWANSKKVLIGGAKALLSTLAIGGLLIALGKFLQSDTFKKMTKFIEEEILPYLTEIGIAIASIVGVVAIAKFIAIANKVRNAFIAVKVFMLETMLEKVKGMIGGALTKGAQTFTMVATLVKNAFIAVKVFMLETMLPAVKGMIGGVVGTFVSIAGKIAAAFSAVVAFMTTTMLPAITAFMTPLLPFIAIAAAVSLILYSLWEAFQDFNKTLEETGSIGEAIKKSLTTFFSTLVGIIPALFLKLVAFVADMFGFEEFAKKIGDIDPIAWIAKSIEGLISDVVDFFKMLFDFDFSGYIGGMIKKAGGLVGEAFSFITGGSEQTPEQMTQERVKKLESQKEALSNKGSNPENRAEIAKYDAEIEALKLSADESLAKPTVLPKTQLSASETLEAQKLKPAQFKESASIVENMEKSKQQAELARQQQQTAAGPTNIVDARQSSSVTTTGQTTGVIMPNKFCSLNAVVY